VLDGTGVLTNREEFSPYGETSFGSYARKRYRFTGQERDEESGLSMHGARYYAPWLARWTSVDPVGLQGGNNLYAYCAAEPLALVDRDGRNFTVVIDFDKSTIVLGSVIVVRTEKDRAQVAAALDDFNKKAPAVNYNGMAVTFDVKVRLDPDDFGKVRPKPSEYRINEYNSERWGDRVPREVNSIPDNRGNFGYTGGVTRLARNITMTHHDNWGNLGGVPDFVKHEILHTFGLDDKGDPYYVAGGLMEPSVVFRFFGARDPQGANNVRLRKEEISMIMKFVDDYFPELTDPRSKYHVEATPIVDFVHSRAPGARVFSTFDAARADYLREINKSTLEGLPATPPPLPELPSTSKQPATNP
jgi:RHS repeat-associated protein